MSLLEVITKASSSIPTLLDEETDYPIVLNPEPILLKLKPESDPPQAQNPVQKVTGWEISQTDHELIELGQKFCKKVRRNLKNTNSLGKAEFLDMVTSHLENIANKVGVSIAFEKAAEGYICKLAEKLGALMGRDVKGLILEGCISLEVWDVLESLIVNGAVEHASASNLVHKLIEKRRSELVVLCVKHLLDLQAYDLMCILKYFLMMPSDGYKSLVSVREDWENQASLAIEKASGKGVGGKEKSSVKEAAVLIMLGHDGFSVSELCLHYLLASPNLDEVIFAACVSKLNGDELKALIQYLGKWLRKYERFPQVVPCPKGSSALGLEVCDWIPSLENVAKYLGVVVDEHFSSLVLHSEFCELRSLEEVVTSLAVEARLCGALANLAERLRIERQGMDSTLSCIYTTL
ncbi:hypothetical protein C2S53_016935 [Perilla frutescens var. hirtella]|uniref:Uncharacterized protein n=1 Tax=Perilla frutescens var. hirtella TaxID=608512 RepID=A0AAD4NYA9_PERFH|nr:hypothetical protein C2S53_016935 [Perilla frutescens var. hirtella]